MANYAHVVKCKPLPHFPIRASAIQQAPLCARSRPHDDAHDCGKHGQRQHETRDAEHDDGIPRRRVLHALVKADLSPSVFHPRYSNTLLVRFVVDLATHQFVDGHKLKTFLHQLR